MSRREDVRGLDERWEWGVRYTFSGPGLSGGGGVRRAVFVRYHEERTGDARNGTSKREEGLAGILSHLISSDLI